MSAGAPILTTKFVKDEFSGDPPFLLSNISEFPTKIIESLSDENLLKSLREKTLDYVNKYNHENSDHEYFLNAIDHLTKIELKK
jgi:hypothetical protein